jgi:putrescine aminotransferase
VTTDRDSYGTEASRSLFDETYENYKNFVNPPLARVMKLSGAPVAVRAHGCTIWDGAGRAYLDFAGGYGVFTLGHTHARVTAAVREQLDVMALSGKTMFEPLVGRLARALADIAPGDCSISFFANSGTEAVEGALKLARASTKRVRIVATTNAYHGKTMGALAASGRDAYKTPFGPLLPDVVHVPYGDVGALADALHDAAAFIVEPVQGEGGVVVPPLGYLRSARELCNADGALLIADEVQTGLGRCGYTFACERDGVVPDVLVLAKGLSGGIMPIGAYVARPGAWNAAYAKAPLAHTSTFGGSPLACAAALAALEVLRDDDLVARSRALGERLLAGAAAIATEYPSVVRATRGLGLLVGVELQNEGYGGTIIPEMLKRGVTAAWTLNAQWVIRLEPPLIVTAAEIDAALEALRAGVAAAYERLGTLPEATAH